MDNKHTVRFHFWRSRYNPGQHESQPGADSVMSWEDRVFSSFEAAMRFAKSVDSPLVKVMNAAGQVIYNNTGRLAHLAHATYA